MSRFDSIRSGTGARPVMIRQLGRVVKYHAPDADDVSLTAHVGAVGIDEDDDRQGRTRRRTRTVRLMTDPSSDFGGVAEPALEDSLTIDGEVWNVAEIVSVGGGVAELRLVAAGKARIGFGEHRV